MTFLEFRWGCRMDAVPQCLAGVAGVALLLRAWSGLAEKNGN